MPPPFLANSAWARVGKPGEGDFGLGKSQVSLFSLRPPTPALLRVRRGAQGTFRQSGPRARHPPPRVPGPPPQAGTGGPRLRQPHLLPQGPLAAHPPPLCGKCGSAGETARGCRARILPQSSLLSLGEDPLEGGSPGPLAALAEPRQEKAAEVGASESRRGLGGAFVVPEAVWGSTHSAGLVVEGNDYDLVGIPVWNKFPGWGVAQKEEAEGR